MANSNHQCNLTEGVEMSDLARLVKPVMSIDEFRSKMGEDKDVIVVAFTVMGKEPAEDLVNFIEKSYDWVLDADISSGETSDGNYMVFIELERKPTAIKDIVTMLEDMLNLTDQKMEDWTFTYYKDEEALPVTEENIEEKLISTPQEYELRTNDGLEESIQLNHLRSISGVKVKPEIITDMQILCIQRAAGIK